MLLPQRRGYSAVHHSPHRSQHRLDPIPSSLPSARANSPAWSASIRPVEPSNPLSRQGQLQDVATAFNNMAERLADTSKIAARHGSTRRRSDRTQTARRRRWSPQSAPPAPCHQRKAPSPSSALELVRPSRRHLLGLKAARTSTAIPPDDDLHARLLVESHPHPEPQRDPTGDPRGPHAASP